MMDGLWCRVDPIVRFGDQRARLLIAVPMTHWRDVNGPVEIRVEGIDDNAFRMLSKEDLFGFQPEIRYIVNPDLEVWATYHVMVRVPSDEEFTVEVEIVYEGPSDVYDAYIKEGQSNQWIELEL